ncbi:MAG TPA: hypothetical protein VHX60_18905 [Acidobacteriaceae bacterium]|nr:hypothetical protein [Acidobacteriaceae bacterium]
MEIEKVPRPSPKEIGDVAKSLMVVSGFHSRSYRASGVSKIYRPGDVSGNRSEDRVPETQQRKVPSTTAGLNRSVKFRFDDKRQKPSGKCHHEIDGVSELRDRDFLPAQVTLAVGVCDWTVL